LTLSEVQEANRIASEANKTSDEALAVAKKANDRAWWSNLWSALAVGAALGGMVIALIALFCK
jgi:hypothetical protein